MLSSQLQLEKVFWWDASQDEAEIEKKSMAEEVCVTGRREEKL